MKNEKINERTEAIMGQVDEMIDKFHSRLSGVDFEQEALTENNLNDIRFHLGYTKSYSDLAKVRLNYYKIIKDEQR